MSKLTSDGNTPDGKTVLCALAQETRGLARASKTVQSTGSGVQIRVTSRERRDENDCVDDGRQSLDFSVVDSNDVWRCGCVISGVEQPGVVIGNEPANNDNSSDVEEKNSVEHTADGFGDVATGVLSFGSSKGNNLSSEERESRVDEGGPEGEETTLRTGDTV